MPIVACGVENDGSLASDASCALQLLERDDQVRGGAHGVDAGRRRGGVRRAAMDGDVERGLALVAVDDPELGRLADDHAGERRGDPERVEQRGDARAGELLVVRDRHVQRRVQ